MSIPPIDLRWGGGKWPSGPKRRLRPVVSNALGLAVDCMEGLEIFPTEPKQATIWRVSETFPNSGETDGSVDFDIHIPNSYIKRPRKTPELTVPLSLVAIHEVIHCVRFEYFDREDLLERAASEGISLFAERSLAHAVLTDEELDKYGYSFQQTLSPEWERTVLDEFLEDVSLEAASQAIGIPESENDTLHELWFENDDGIILPMGYQIGLIAVGRIVSAGATLDEIIRMPAEDIVGLEV